MTDTLSIYRGDTAGPWNVGVTGDDGALVNISAPWTCKIKVAGTAIDRAVGDRTVDNLRFIAALTPAETDTLEIGVYVVAIEIENTTTTPPLRREHHIVLTVTRHVVGSSDMPEPPSEIDRLTALKEALEDALLTASSGSPVEVWNGRYGNKVKYQTMSYDQIEAALSRVKRDLAAEQRVAAGGARRAPVGVFWN
jgi:hypothetical protein